MHAARRSSARLGALVLVVSCGPSPSRDTTVDTPPLEAGAALWTQQLAGAGYPSARDVAFDGGGNIVIAGSFQDELTIADSKLTGAGLDDIFAARFDGDGQLLWAHGWGGDGIDGAHALGVGPDGAIWLAGPFERTLALGDAELTARANPDVFVARLSPAGKVELAVQLTGTGTAQVDDLAVTADGGAVLVGFFDGTLAVAGLEPLASAGMQDGYVAKLARDGTPQWAFAIGGATTDYAKAVAVNSRGDVIATGQFRGEAKLGAATLRSAGAQTDIFLTTIDAETGTPIWTKSFGGGGTDGAYAVAVDDGDNVIVAGRFDKAALFGSSPLEPEGGFDVFLAKYNAAGDHIWSRRLGGPGADNVTDVAIAGHVILVTGEFEGRARFGGDPLESAGRHDGFFAKYSAAGAPVWARRFGGEGQDQLDAVAMTADGAAAAVGAFHHSAEFGDTKLTATGIYEPVLLRVTP